ncbi:MAG: rhomboid family intramembrane serine protease [bacterium]
MPATIAICNVIIIALTTYLSWKGFKSPEFQERYLFSTTHILDHNQYYRLISSGFLHTNWIHLLFNMFSLYSFGSHIEIIFGIHKFFIIYFVSILGGNIVSLYFHRNHYYQALGASGGVCGIIFAAIFLLPGGGVYIFPVPFPIPSYLYAILFVLISFSGMWSQTGNIGHDAHLGGAIVGLLTTTMLYPFIIQKSPLLYFAVMGIAVLLFFYTYKYPLYFQKTNPLNPADWRYILTDIKTSLKEKRRISSEQLLDRILDKISRSGIDSLTASEKKLLKKISQRMRKSGKMH